MVIAAALEMWKSRTCSIVSGRISGTSPESTSTCSKPCKSLPRLHHGMAGATLLKLFDELDSRGMQVPRARVRPHAQ